MNKLLFCILVITATSIQAQNYNPFKVNFSLGYVRPVGSGLTDGFLVGIEPNYSISSHLDLGLRLESVVVVRGVTWGANNRANSGNVSTRNSAVLTFTYLFNSVGSNNLRPFVGAGLGAFSLPSAGTVRFEENQTIKQLPVNGYWGIGGMIRGGFKVGHFVASIEYNPVPAHVYSTENTNIDFTTRGSYASVRLGFDIGGGTR